MKQTFIRVINRGDFNLAELLGRIDRFYAAGRLTEAESDELCALAREKASVENSVNVIAKLVELEARVKALEEASGTATDPEEPSTADDYQVGKWYYQGDRVTFENEVYICSAPEGVVCTWSPTEYPAYWTKE